MAKKQKQKDYSEFIVTAAALAEEQGAGVRMFLQIEPDELRVVLQALKRFHEQRERDVLSE